MKKTILTLAIALAFLAATATSFAEVKEVKIQTSATCDMCKSRIEKSINQLDGVITSNLDLDNKMVTVKYDDKTASVEKIKKAISMAGYKADDMAADPKAYKMLPDHCKGVAVIKGVVKPDEKTTTDAKASCCKGDKAKAGTCKQGEMKASCCTGDKAKMETCKPKDGKTCCPASSTVKIDGKATIGSKCDSATCKTPCPSVKATETEETKTK